MIARSTQYAKVVYWSDDDQCFIRSCPGVIGSCCHGDDEQAVFAALCGIVEDVVNDYEQSDETLPTPPETIPLNEAAAHVR